MLPLLISAPGADTLAVNLAFLTLMLPGMFISAIGSTVLGIGLLRSHYTPKLTPWLLTLAFPSMLIIPTVLGCNNLGMIPSSWRGASPAFSSGGHTTMPRYHRIPAAQIPDSRDM